MRSYRFQGEMPTLRNDCKSMPGQAGYFFEAYPDVWPVKTILSAGQLSIFLNFVQISFRQII